MHRRYRSSRINRVGQENCSNSLVLDCFSCTCCVFAAYLMSHTCWWLWQSVSRSFFFSYFLFSFLRLNSLCWNHFNGSSIAKFFFLAVKLSVLAFLAIMMTRISLYDEAAPQTSSYMQMCLCLLKALQIAEKERRITLQFKKLYLFAMENILTGWLLFCLKMILLNTQQWNHKIPCHL